MTIYELFATHKGKLERFNQETWNRSKTFSYQNRTYTVERVVKKTYGLDGKTAEVIFQA